MEWTSNGPRSNLESGLVPGGRSLRDAGVRISMDGKGRWMDNVFIERLWRSLKYECVYLNAFETGTEARLGIGQWIERYNSQRPHSTHQGATPGVVVSVTLVF